MDGSSISLPAPSLFSSPSAPPISLEWIGSGVVGAAESVCAMEFSVRAASASERVFGVRPEGVPGVKVPVDGGRRRDGGGLASPIVEVLIDWFCWEGGQMWCDVEIEFGAWGDLSWCGDRDRGRERGRRVEN